MFELAEEINGKLFGDGNHTVNRLVHPAEWENPQDLALAMDKELLPILKQKQISTAIILEGAEKETTELRTFITVSRPRLVMAKLTNLFADKSRPNPGIHATAVIEQGAVVEEGCFIGAFSYICSGAVIGRNSIINPQVYIGSGAQIGENALIYSGVKIGKGVKIGSNCIIHFNASVGADGFSFVTPQPGSVESAKSTGAIEGTNEKLIRIASLGSVEIGDNVEIGANTSIDRGTISSTRIGSGTKIDNQVQIGHNVIIGENCMLCGRVGIAGSAVIGDRVVLGGAVGVADHVKIGDDAVVMAMSGVAGNIPPKSLVGGLPAKPRQRIIEEQLLIGRLKNLFKKVEAISDRLNRLEQE